jgi:hypothetical protein
MLLSVAASGAARVALSPLRRLFEFDAHPRSRASLRRTADLSLLPLA